MQRSAFILFVALLGLLLSCNPAYAQSAGAITGRVVDADTGQGIAGATIVVKPTGFHRERARVVANCLTALSFSPATGSAPGARFPSKLPQSARHPLRAPRGTGPTWSRRR
jgi:hypothetical protein